MSEAPAQQITTPATTYQLALNLFDDLWPAGLPIADAPVDVGFQRNNIFIAITDLGLVARRALDAAYFIVSRDPKIQRVYDEDLVYFQWLMTYASNNRKHFRGILRELQRAAIQVHVLDHTNPEDDRWGSIPLLGSVGIAGGRIVFEVHDTLQRNIKDPASSHYFSLCCNGFTTVYGRVIYDHLLPDVARGATDWLDVDTVRTWPGTTAKSNATFKYFKRDALEPAVQQINNLTPLAVRYETRSEPGSKKISKIRFIITRKHDTQPLQQVLRNSTDMYVTLRDEFGLSPKNFEEIMSNRDAWTDERIHQSIEFTRFNIKRGKVTKSASGFLMKALRDDLRVAHSDRVIADQLAAQEARSQERERKALEQVAAKEEGDAQRLREVAASITAGLERFDRLSGEARLAYLSSYSRTLEAKLAASRAGVPVSGLTETLIRTHKPLADSFGVYMHQQSR